MNRKPRDPSSTVLSRELVLRMIMVGVLLLLGSFGLFEWELSHGESEAAARTAAVNVFVTGELFYLFNCRSLNRSTARLGFFSNRWLIAGVTVMVVLQLLFTYLPYMNFLFHSEPIGMPEWLVILLVGGTVYGIVGLEKLLQGK